MALDRRSWIRLAAAGGIAVSGGIHLRLYRDGYRDIHLDRLLGVDLSRSFALAVASATVLSMVLVATVIWRRGAWVASVAALIYAAGTLAAYVLTRTNGVLGFEENRWITEAVIAKPVELAVVLTLLLGLIWRPSRATDDS
jgi:uncharacterized membrane protein YhdT